MEKRMNMRDFVRTMKNDIDVYNNVTDDDGNCSEENYNKWFK